ncbi:RNA polymerase sigma factor [bacterium]|nr:RNA polymerase sigma factor [bacterium]
MKEFDDATLVQKARNDDKVAFGELVNRYQHYLYQTVYARLLNREDAEDLAQEAFCKAFLCLKQLKEPDKFKYWLKQIAVNTCTDWLRSHSKKHEVSEPLVKNTRTTLNDQTIQNFSDTQILEELRDAINSLSEVNREAVIRHYFEGYSYQEISQDLGIPVSTVRSRLQEARKNLRVDLASVAIALNLSELRAPSDFVQRVMESIKHLHPTPKGNVGRFIPSFIIGFLALSTVLFFIVKYQSDKNQSQLNTPPQTNNTLLFDDFEDGDYTANPLWRFLRDVENEIPASYQVVETDGSLAIKLVEFDGQSAHAWTPVSAEDFILTLDVKATHLDAVWRISAHTYIDNFDDIGIQALQLRYEESNFQLKGGVRVPGIEYPTIDERPVIPDDERFHHYEITRQNGLIQVKRDGEIILSGEDLASEQFVGAIMLSGYGHKGENGVGAYFDNVMAQAIKH